MKALELLDRRLAEERAGVADEVLPELARAPRRSRRAAGAASAAPRTPSPRARPRTTPRPRTRPGGPAAEARARCRRSCWSARSAFGEEDDRRHYSGFLRRATQTSSHGHRCAQPRSPSSGPPRGRPRARRARAAPRSRSRCRAGARCARRAAARSRSRCRASRYPEAELRPLERLLRRLVRPGRAEDDETEWTRKISRPPAQEAVRRRDPDERVAPDGRAVLREDEVEGPVRERRSSALAWISGNSRPCSCLELARRVELALREVEADRSRRAREPGAEGAGAAPRSTRSRPGRSGRTRSSSSASSHIPHHGVGLAQALRRERATGRCRSSAVVVLIGTPSGRPPTHW